MVTNVQPLVSVLIPLYNQERYFKACMRSVIKQTYQNLEIIIVNDGSTDKSPKMAKDWAKQDNRVRVIDKHNEGLAFARRDGLLVATGEYVMFLDSDDLLRPHGVESLVNTALRTDVDVVYASFTKKIGFIRLHKADRDFSFPKGKKITQPELFEEYYLAFFRNNIFPVSVWARLYRKEVLDKAMQETDLYSQDNSFMGEDHYFNMKLFPYLNSIYRIEDEVYEYRYGGGTFGYNKKFPQVFTLFDKRFGLLNQYNYVQGYKPLYEDYIACLYGFATQMIHFKEQKQNVLNHFKHELEERVIVPSLLDYYTENRLVSERVKMMLEHDYEGMYARAKADDKFMYDSFNYKVKRFLVILFSSL